MATSEVLVVRYENGTNEVFNVQSNTSGAVISDEVMSGMRYKEYKKLYVPKSYTRMPGDVYLPGVSGVCSWLIPGLGQMICGEVGRGFGYLGGTVGCGIIMGIGSSLFVSGLDWVENDNYEVKNEHNAGVILMLAGSAALLAVDICAIVDAVRVAKVKNMYERDVRNMASLSIKLEPYFASTVGMNNNIAAGASLKIRF